MLLLFIGKTPLGCSMADGLIMYLRSSDGESFSFSDLSASNLSRKESIEQLHPVTTSETYGTVHKVDTLIKVL
jgi:hypothetical protein